MNKEPTGREVPRKGDTWRHFKCPPTGPTSNTYRILALGYMEAKPADVYVIYQRSGSYGPVWLRPVAEFMSTVIGPDGRFIFRFELVTRGVTE